MNPWNTAESVMAKQGTAWALKTCIVWGLVLVMTASCSSRNSRLPNLETGLNETTCWFGSGEGLPAHTCYYMTTKETPGADTHRTISFPVVVFHQTLEHAQSPILHLGGGGPGGSLSLESDYNVASIVDRLGPLSLDIGRDLYLIDPRGSGQARPLLMCQEFVDHVIPRWKKPITLLESYKDANDNFQVCVDELIEDGLDFAAFNSTNVVKDFEQLRRAMKVDRWVLYGASYGSVYAQIYARDYPSRVEAMLLDSATFLDTPRHENLLQEITKPYERLFGYCEVSNTCVADNGLENTAERFWNLVHRLDRAPIEMRITNYNTGRDFTTHLTGWRFLDAMLWGLYEEDIFTDFPTIMDQLERRETLAVRKYVEYLLLFLLDESYGDISATSHYCVDMKPYTDDQLMRDEILKVPYPYARDIALLGMDFTDFCDEMSIAEPPGSLGDPIKTDVPTLFMHGLYDTVTLLDHVTEREPNFSNSHIVTANQSHIVLDDPCVLRTARLFLRTGIDEALPDTCTSSAP